MKKLITFLAVLVFSTLATADPYNMILTQRNAADTGNNTRIQPTPAGPAVWSFDTNTLLPGYWVLGSSLTVTNGVLDVTMGAAQVNANWTATSGVAQILNKPALATVATTGNYGDLTNTPAAPSQSGATRSLNSGFQVSTTRSALAHYSVGITTTASIAGAQAGSVTLEIASDAGFTTNVQTLAVVSNSQSYTLAVAIQGVQAITSELVGFVPAGYYVRMRTTNVTGTPSFAFTAGQEVLL